MLKKTSLVSCYILNSIDVLLTKKHVHVKKIPWLESTSNILVVNFISKFILNLFKFFIHASFPKLVSN
jgi:hypothetical protein